MSNDESTIADQFRALAEASDDAIIVKSLENRILSWSPGAERIYGYTAGEAVGQPITILFPPGNSVEADDILQMVRRGQRLQRFETVRVARDGRPIDVSLTVTPIRNATGEITGTLTIAHETHSRTSASLNGLRENEENRALVLETAGRVALDILASRTGRGALHHIADAARTLAGARYAALGVARLDGRGLLEFVTVGMSAEEEARVGPHPRGAGVLGLLLHRNEPLRIDKLSDHPSSIGFPPNHPPMESFLGVPIRRGETVIGSLYLTNKLGGGAFTERDEEAVESLGAHAAVAIYNLHMLHRQRSLVSGLINAQEEERRAVAYDLHDGLTQFVMASHAHLEAFRHAHETGKSERAQREMEQALTYLKEAVTESRRLVNGLRSLALDDLGLPGAIEQLLADEKKRAGWEDADLVHNIEGTRFDKTVETAVYRVVQEALTNARKHAQTACARVMLLVEPGDRPGAARLTVEIRDWGIGFNPDQFSGDYSRVGLQGMAERVSLIGGTYHLNSEPGQGTIVRAVVPAMELPPDARRDNMMEDVK